MTWIKNRALVVVSLATVIANASLFLGNDHGGSYPLWVPIGGLAIISLPALLNIGLGILHRPKTRAVAFTAIASIPSFFGIAIYLLLHGSSDGQAGLAGLALVVLQAVLVPLFWGVAALTTVDRSHA